MNEAPKPDRFQFIRWALLVVVMLVGLWLPSRGLPVVSMESFSIETLPGLSPGIR